MGIQHKCEYSEEREEDGDNGVTSRVKGHLVPGHQKLPVDLTLYVPDETHP